MRLPFVGGGYALTSLAAAAQESMNVYVEVIEDPNERGKNKEILRGIPGTTLFVDLTAIDALAHPVRGLWSGGGRLFVVAGTKYFEVDPGGALVGAVYTVLDDSAHSPVQMFHNGNQLLIVASGIAYCDNGAGPVQITFSSQTGQVNTNGADVTWNGVGDPFDVGLTGQAITINGVGYTVLAVWTNQFLKLTGSAGVQTGVVYSGTPVLTAGTGAFLDGYFLVSRPASRQVNFSAIGDGTKWSGLDFFIKESWSDHVLWIYSDNEQLYVGGPESGEVWQTDPTGNAAFVRLNGAATRTGSVGPNIPASMSSHLYYVGGSPRGAPVVYRLDGFRPTRISTHAVEESLATINLAAASSYTYLEDGHFFFAIIPSPWSDPNIAAFVYDETASGDLGFPQWAQRADWTPPSGLTPGFFIGYTPAFHTFIPEWPTNGRHIVGSWLDGKLYLQSNTIFARNGADIAWRRALPYQYNDGCEMYFGRVELEMDTGESPGGPIPTVTYDYSDDRGKTFIGAATAPIGDTGDTAARVVWPFPTGASRGRVPRFFGSGQAKVCLINCIAEIDIGTA